MRVDWAALEEAVGDAGVGAEDVGRVGGEPGGLGDGEDVSGGVFVSR